MDPHLVLYAVDGVTGGTDAQASAHVRLELNGRIVIGQRGGARYARRLGARLSQRVSTGC